VSDAAAAPARPTAQEVVARERAQRTKVGIASILAGILTFVGGIASGAVYSDAPTNYVVDALREAAGQGQGLPLRTRQVLFFDDKAVQLVLVAVALGLAALLTAYVLLFVYGAIRARDERTRGYLRGIAIAGGLLVGLSTIAVNVGVAVEASSFASGEDRSAEAARDVLDAGWLLVAQGLTPFGTLFLALSFVLVGLNGMRVGLLTRFLGIIAIIAGVLLILPLSGGLPVVQTFFLVALGLLLLGRISVPPAWSAGEAVPWPSQQELAERRELERRQAGGDADDDPRTEAPSPATSKKKRKRR
jgi:hypothetical protein